MLMQFRTAYGSCPVSLAGAVLFEIGGADELTAKKALNRMSHKLPVKSKLLRRKEAL